MRRGKVERDECTAIWSDEGATGYQECRDFRISQCFADVAPRRQSADIRHKWE